jgi:uncharacterized protein (DUF3084 family)
MAQDRQEKIKKLQTAISEAYDYQVALKKKTISDIEESLKSAKYDLHRLEEKQLKLEHNLSRATDSDLNSYHFLFFSTEIM